MDPTTSLPLRQHGSGRMLDIGGRCNDVPSIIHSLQVLQETDLTLIQNIVFMVWPDGPIDRVVDLLVGTMQVCSNKNYRFDRFIFHHYDYHNENHLMLLQAACHYKLFKFLVVASVEDGTPPQATMEALKDAMITNKGLKEMNVRFELSKESFGILGEGLKESDSLESLTIDVGPSHIRSENITLHPVFLEALQENKSIKMLSLNCLPGHESIEAILTALLDHPMLKSLKLNKSCWGDSSIAALGALLCSPQCEIHSVSLTDPMVDTRQVLADKLGSAIKNNQSLEFLGLRGLGLDDAAFERMWEDISILPKLTWINLECNNISSLNKLPRSKESRLRELNLWENPIYKLEPSETEASGILEFLDAHPTVLSFGSDFVKYKGCTPEVQHMLDLNANGRYLFTDGNTIVPWAKVLERGNKKLADSRTRQASVMYELLRGISASL